MCIAVVAVLVSLIGFNFFVKPYLAKLGWQKLADELGLQYTAEKGIIGKPSPGRLDGTNKGRTIQIFIFEEHSHTGDGDLTQYYLQFYVGLRKKLQQRLIVQKNWRRRFMHPDRGMPLPDLSFSERYAITLSEPQDFALKIFQSDSLREQFNQSLGKRAAFQLTLEKQSLFCNSRASGWLLPANSVEWRPQVLRQILNTLSAVADQAETVDTANRSVKQQQIAGSIRSALDELLKEKEYTLLICTDTESRFFIHFLKIHGNTIIFKIPYQSLPNMNCQAVAAYFKDRQFKTGLLLADKESIQVEFMMDDISLNEAARLGMCVFFDVYACSERINLDFTYGDQ